MGMRILRAETAVAERPAAGRSPVMRPGSQASAPFYHHVRSSALVIAVQSHSLVSCILGAETVVAERSAARRSPVMLRGSQSNASLSSTYARPR